METYNSNGNNHQWTNNPEESIQTELQPMDLVNPNLRQQAKIVSCLLTENDEVLADNSVFASREDFDQIYDRISSGKIGRAEEKELLSKIIAPRHKYSPMEILTGTKMGPDGRLQEINGISNDRQMRRILAEMTGVGFSNPEKLTDNDVAAFWAKFETPVDFEDASQHLLNQVRRFNSIRKYNQYVESMRNFKKVMFGKQQEYWEQMQLMEREAFSRPQVQSRELEENAELPLVSDFGITGISRGSVRAGMFDGMELKDDGTSEDATLSLPEDGLFGVFDGVGGLDGGKRASSMAALEVAQFGSAKIDDPTDLCRILDRASDAIRAMPEAGQTTGTIAKICEEGGKKLLYWASVGDSRLYLIPKEGAAQQISKDEGEGNMIYNSLGNRSHLRATQRGVFELHNGDSIVLCSDGITGDYEADKMPIEELESIVRNSNSCAEASSRLVLNARKIDDRTALVVKV